MPNVGYGWNGPDTSGIFNFMLEAIDDVQEPKKSS